MLRGCSKAKAPTALIGRFGPSSTRHNLNSKGNLLDTSGGHVHINVGHICLARTVSYLLHKNLNIYKGTKEDRLGRGSVQIATEKANYKLISLGIVFLPPRTTKLWRGYRVCPVRAGPRSAVGRALDSLVRGPGFDTRSGHILSFLLPLIQEGQLSVTGESMCTKYWLTA